MAIYQWYSCNLDCKSSENLQDKIWVVVAASWTSSYQTYNGDVKKLYNSTAFSIPIQVKFKNGVGTITSRKVDQGPLLSMSLLHPQITRPEG